MLTIITKNKFFPLQLLIFSAFAVFILFMWQGNKGFDLGDEGFLWYGAQRVILGEVPVRDFMSYDPGRYYWSAVLMSLWGDNGIMTLRGAIAIFQTIGLFTGLLLIARVAKKQNLFYLLLAAITLLAWMFLNFKLFDISLSIFLICALTFLIQNPTTRGYFFAGLGVGLLAFFGRNHGVYGIVGSIGVMFWLNIKREEGPGLIKGFMLLSAGVTVGYMPILFMVLLVPGFAVAFWESIQFFLFEINTTRPLPLPVPWPWQVDFATLSIGKAIREVLVGLFYIAIAFFSVLSIIWVVSQKLRNRQVSPALVAAAFLAPPYTHYALSRASLEYLSMGIFPLLIGCLVILATQPTKLKWTLSLMLCAVSIFTTSEKFPGWYCASKPCKSIEISGSNIVVGRVQAHIIGIIRKLADQYAPDGRSFVVTPHWPSAYALLERKSPMWEIWAIFPRSQSYEQAQIEQIKESNPGFIFIFDWPFDKREDLRFKNTHPLTYQYFLDHFEQIPASASQHPNFHFYREKENAQ